MTGVGGAGHGNLRRERDGQAHLNIGMLVGGQVNSSVAERFHAGFFSPTEGGVSVSLT